MEWLREAPWAGWLALALISGVVEVLTLDFVFLMVAGGALLTTGLAGVGAPFPVQVLGFAGSTVALLGLVRPGLRRWAAAVPEHATNTEALLGREVVVLSPVGEQNGRVKLAGEEWSARTAPGPQAHPLEVGSRAVVIAIDGATAVVAPQSYQQQLSES